MVIYHTSFSYREGVHTEFQGVAIFFVISGFIMTHISRNDPVGFFYHRCVRIIPLYFLITFAVFLAKLRTLLPFDIFHYLAIEGGAGTDLSLTTLAKSLFFVPYKNSVGEWQPINAVGWTLNLEMYFYVIYSMALLVTKRFAPLVVSIIVLLVKLLGDSCADNVCAFYAHSYINYFVFGIIAYYLWQGMLPLLESSRRVVHWSGVLFASAFLFWHLSPEFSTLFTSSFITLINNVLPFIVVLVALCLHSVNVRCDLKPFLILGEASYALYLIHTVVIGQMRSMGFVIDAYSGLGMLAIVVTVSTFIALVLHYGFERPATRFLRSVLPARLAIRRVD